LGKTGKGGAERTSDDKNGYEKRQQNGLEKYAGKDQSFKWTLK